MVIRKLTPIFVVDRIEPALPFYLGLGFTKTVEVPHGEHLGFVILVHGEREIMLQTHASLRADLGVADLAPTCALYADVESLDDARASVAGARVLIESRQTFYGARECWVLDPAGVLVGFSQH
jgi:uncharacterized glyoxalase superfamily protein PhnB